MNDDALTGTLKKCQKDLENGTLSFTLSLSLTLSLSVSLSHTQTHTLSLHTHTHTMYLHPPTVKRADVEYWQNPQMFLASGPHGPFYRLHSFRATSPLDSEEDIKTIKIAGTLRHEVNCSSSIPPCVYDSFCSIPASMTQYPCIYDSPFAFTAPCTCTGQGATSTVWSREESVSGQGTQGDMDPGIQWNVRVGVGV